jgi:integrase/recombinase XerD
MTLVRWVHFPCVAASRWGRPWLQMLADLQVSPRTIVAYGHGLEDYLRVCAGHEPPISPEEATREDIATYVRAMRERPNPPAGGVLNLSSGAGLSNATMQLRVTAVRRWYDYLIDKGVREDNPVGRGRYTPGRGWAGVHDRGLIPRYHPLPWIPTDEEWETLLAALAEETLRTKVMAFLSYDGALRREELCQLEIRDLDLARRQITVRAEITKNRRAHVVAFGATSGQWLSVYLRHRRSLSAERGPLFLSESRRNYGQRLDLGMWSKVVSAWAKRAGVPRFTTHTFRHLRLTHLAREGWDLHELAAYAGHRSIQTTMDYLVLGGTDLAERLAHTMGGREGVLATALHKGAD